MPGESPNEQPAIDLRHIVVRPIVRDEKAAFKSLLARHHYLGPAPLIGQSIQYLACVQERWLALLVFAAVALKSRPRDHWIGWPPCFHWQGRPAGDGGAQLLHHQEAQAPGQQGQKRGGSGREADVSGV